MSEVKKVDAGSPGNAHWSRRSVLAGAAVAATVGSVGIVGLNSSPAGAASIPYFYDVTAYGATGNGTTPDDAAINSAISAAGSAGGGVVWFPAGHYLLTNTITVPEGVSLEGVGADTSGASSPGGSWIYIRASQNGHSFTPVIVRGYGSAIRRLGFNYPEQSTTNLDIGYSNYAIEVLLTEDVVIEDVFSL